MSDHMGSNLGTVSTAALTKMEGKIGQLPLLPQVLVRILQLNATQNDYFDELERLAREDPPFAVRLLVIANSASSSPLSPIKTVKDALTRIGASTITGLVASLAVQRVFVPSSPSQLALWQHSIRVAVAAETVAQLVPVLKVDKGQAYLAGLLHDIGRFVMFEHAPEHLLKVDESNWNSPDKLIEADVDVFKYTHSELGYLACKHWSLPDELACIVRRHHDRLGSTINPGSLEANILCIELADHLVMRILENQELDGLSTEELAAEISQKCLCFAETENLVKADVLANRFDIMKAQCEQLFSGLGLN